MVIAAEFILTARVNPEINEGHHYLYFHKSFSLEEIPRTGEQVAIETSDSAIFPVVNNVRWRLPDHCKITLGMHRRLTGFEIDFVIADGWIQYET